MKRNVHSHSRRLPRRNPPLRSRLPERKIGPVENRKGHVLYERVPRAPLLRKWFDTNWFSVGTVTGISVGNTAAISNVGSHFNICAIATGTDRINRIGRSVTIRGFEIRMMAAAGVDNTVFSGQTNNTFRLMLYRLRSIDPITSAVNMTTNLFPVGDPITAIADADDVAEIYFDKTVTARVVSGTAGTGSAQVQALLHEALQLYVPVTYTNTGAANVESNMIILSIWSDYISTGQTPKASASFRVFFEDD